MNKQFDILRKTRQHLLGYIADLSVAQLNEIPKGLKNNIIWNMAHVIAAQQGVCYRRGGLPFTIEEALFNNYKPDTFPQPFVDLVEINKIKDLLLSNIDDLERDYHNGLFSKNPAWVNRYGIELVNIEDTINFLMLHEGIHLGCVFSLKKLV